MGMSSAEESGGIKFKTDLRENTAVKAKECLRGLLHDIGIFHNILNGHLVRNVLFSFTQINTIPP